MVVAHSVHTMRNRSRNQRRNLWFGRCGSSCYRPGPMVTSSNETFSGLLALCVGTSSVTDEFPSQRPVARSLDVFIDLRLNKRFSEQSRCWRFETPSRTLLYHCNTGPETRSIIYNSVYQYTYFIFGCILSS